MGNIKTVLKEMYPGRERFTPDEVALARRVMEVCSSRSSRSARFPSIYIPVGGIYESGGVRYRCVARPNVHHRDCCIGCDFDRLSAACPAALQCSKFDRADHRFVWFVKIEDK